MLLPGHVASCFLHGMHQYMWCVWVAPKDAKVGTVAWPWSHIHVMHCTLVYRVRRRKGT